MESPSSLVLATGDLDAQIGAWLANALGRTGSQRTYTAYRDTLLSFRLALRSSGLDLDSDPALVMLAAEGWLGQAWDGSGRQVTNNTYNLRRAILCSFYEYQRTKRPTTANPLRALKPRPVQAYANARALRPDQVSRGLASLDRASQAGARDYALLGVGLVTGRRASELAALTWADVDLDEGGVVTLTFRHAKGGKTMTDELPASVSAALLAHMRGVYGDDLGQMQPEAPLWPSFSNRRLGAPLTIQAIGQLCQRVYGTSKIHTLRHTFAKRMEDRGAKVSEIQARLGHSDIKTTGRYLEQLHSARNQYADDLAADFGLVV